MDWARQIRDLVDVHYRDAECIVFAALTDLAADGHFDSSKLPGVSGKFHERE